MNVLRRWPRRVAEPQAPGCARARPTATRSRGRSRGHGVDPRHDRHRRLPRTHGITGHNVRRGGEPVKAWARPATSTRPSCSNPRWPTGGPSGPRTGVGRRDRVPGVARRDARLRRRPMGDAPVGVYWGRGRRRRLAPPPRRALPPPGRPRDLERLDEPSAGLEPPAPSPYDPAGKKAMCCSLLRGALPGRPDPCDVRPEPIGQDEFADLLLPELQGARLRGARLQHGRPAPGRGARRRRRRDRPASPTCSRNGSGTAGAC